MHNAWRILRKASTALLYMRGLKMVDHPHVLQSGFSWPFFSLIPEILSVVDLSGAGSATCSRIQLYRCALGVWVGVDAGYVIRAGDRVFLTASHVQDTPEFDKHPHASSKETMAHLRRNLP